jgi:hypothetical protein
MEAFHRIRLTRRFRDDVMLSAPGFVGFELQALNDHTLRPFGQAHLQILRSRLVALDSTIDEPSEAHQDPSTTASP